MLGVKLEYGFWIFQDSQYVRVLNFQVYTGFTYFCKYDRVLNIRPDAVMEGFWILQVSQYARVLNFQVFTGFTYFCKYDRVLNISPDAVMEGLWIFQVSKYTKFLHMQVVHKVLNMPEYGWIIPEKKLFWLWQSSAFALSKFHRVLNMPLVLNMPGLRLWQIVNMRGLHRVLNIPEYTWICLNNASKWLNMP